MPRRTLVCEKIFEDEGILGEIAIREFPLYFLPLEPDVLSLELESSFEELYLVRGLCQPGSCLHSLSYRSCAQSVKTTPPFSIRLGRS